MQGRVVISSYFRNHLKMTSLLNSRSKKELLHKINTAINHVQNKHRKKALDIFYKNISDVPDDPEVIIRYGVLCNFLGEFDIAIVKLRKILEQKPDDPVILDLLGSLLIADRQYQEGDELLRKVNAVRPNQWQTLSNLGLANLRLEKYDEAIAFLEMAKSLKSDHSNIYVNLAECLLRTNRESEAMECAHKAIKLDPEDYNAYIVIGLIHAHAGKISEGIKYYEKAIKLDRFIPGGYVNLAAVKKFSANDKKLIAEIEKILEGNMPATDRSLFCFVMGRIYDDCKEWDKAFSCMKRAKLLGRTKYEENPVPKKHLRSLKKTYTRKFFEKNRPLGNPSDIPVFIIGMPRSGSSLVEQIIASHPQAAGAGELGEIAKLLSAVGSTDNPSKYQARVDAIVNMQSIRALSTAYLDRLRHNRETARRIVDKYLNNYFQLGLITLLFPYAKIIHTVRSPLDTCISCYFQYFTHTAVGWSFDPKWITNTYRSYRQTMEFWKSVLPENKILDVQYEDVINEPEHYIRKIIAHCDLEWHPACLEFYNSSNPVKTASVMQVRQPLYRKSIERWKNYGTNAGDFAMGLVEYLSCTEKEYFTALGIKLDAKRWWNIFA